MSQVQVWCPFIKVVDIFTELASRIAGMLEVFGQIKEHEHLKSIVNSHCQLNKKIQGKISFWQVLYFKIIL